MKRNLNFRLIFLLLLLAVLAIREVAVELRPSFLRPGLHMLAYVGNTGDGTVTAIDLIALSRAATIATGPSPSGLRAHPTHPEIWGVSTDGGYAWVIDARSGRLAAKIQVGALPYAIDFSPDGKRAYVAASGANVVVAIDTASRQVTARG
ncbi:MAG: YncE family protein, partial [Candidatus Acidiferrales bacterium]